MRDYKRLVASGTAALMLALAGCAAEIDPTAVGPEQPGSPASLIITAPHSSVAIGEAVQLTGSVVDNRGQTNTVAAITWTSNNPAIATVSETGVVIGSAAGTVTVTAKSGPASGSIALNIVEPPPPPAAKDVWTYCAKAGSLCTFVGLRDVRLGAANGPYVTQTAYYQVACATYGFGGQNPAPGEELHCDVGPVKTTALTNPMPGMGGLGDKVVVPIGSPGVDGSRIRATSNTPVYTDGSGSFRTTCSLANFAFDDPIVLPGKPGASHLHMFFGNTGVHAYSTAQSVATSGNSTCRGGTLNRTGYWMPAVYDSRTGVVQTPEEGVFYYKSGYNIDPTTIQPFPTGLRMIAGDRNATGVQRFIEWTCRDLTVQNTGAITTVCPVGDAVRLVVIFPQCWDGKNLDSPDHKSHMAYPIYRNAPQRSTCPASHPVALPEITEHFDFPVTDPSAPAHWRLTSDMYSASLPGGYSAHADWMNGWDTKTMETIVTQCLNKRVDCGVGSIGNRTELYY